MDSLPEITKEINRISNVKTMSSREIAKLTGKRHDNVVRDIEIMFEKLDGSLLKFEESDFKGTYTERGKTYPCYYLPKRECFILVSGYDVNLRARIIDRWAKLEVDKRQAQFKPQNPQVFITGMLLKELRLLANDNAERLVEAGIDNNQIIISTSRVMESVLGVNTLEGINIPTPNNTHYYTATALGEQLEGKPSGKAINKKLVQLGFLLVELEPSGRRRNVLTPKGKEQGGRYFDEGKQHSDGCIIQSIKWEARILDVLKATL